MNDKTAGRDQAPASASDAGASGHGQSDLERAKLLQEKELKEKELALKEKELEFQHRQSSSARWSTPAVVAIVAGFIGYIGTLISSYQNRQLEREKQEGTLILEAIKTTGSADEKSRQTAANLVFLADAGLITSINKSELDKLREKAQGAGPSLPASQGPAPQGVDFKRSSALTAELQSKLQSALVAYQTSLAKIGYDPGRAKDRISVRIDEDQRDNAYFDNESVVLGVNLARDPEYVLSEYTWYVLKQSNPAAFNALLKGGSVQFSGFSYGLKFYFTCSYLDDPYVGKNFHSLVNDSDADRKRQYLFNLDELKAFSTSTTEPHALGEVWGGAFWELRKKLGREKADRLLFEAWKRLAVTDKANEVRFFVDTVLDASKAAGNEGDSPTIVQAFAQRKLQ